MTFWFTINSTCLEPVSKLVEQPFLLFKTVRQRVWKSVQKVYVQKSAKKCVFKNHAKSGWIWCQKCRARKYSSTTPSSTLIPTVEWGLAHAHYSFLQFLHGSTPLNISYFFVRMLKSHLPPTSVTKSLSLFSQHIPLNSPYALALSFCSACPSRKQTNRWVHKCHTSKS